jgi:hypothetical protein
MHGGPCGPDRTCVTSHVRLDMSLLNEHLKTIVLRCCRGPEIQIRALDEMQRLCSTVQGDEVHAGSQRRATARETHGSIERLACERYAFTEPASVVEKMRQLRHEQSSQISRRRSVKCTLYGELGVGVARLTTESPGLPQNVV